MQPGLCGSLEVDRIQSREDREWIIHGYEKENNPESGARKVSKTCEITQISGLFMSEVHRLNKLRRSRVFGFQCRIRVKVW